jgi:mannose-6-phosphate isomerase-like protein (cupin superfamily)
MPLIKGKDIKAKRGLACGSMIKWYPIEQGNDLLDWVVFSRSMAEEKEWSMQKHSHPDFEEYWFCLDGRGQIIAGDETYEVEPGDLFITPRGVPHTARGDVTFICCTCKYNVHGKKTTKMQYVAADAPYRADPEGKAAQPKVGEYMEIDVTEQYD